MNESSQQYHADLTHVGSSMLKCFRESVPLYHGMYVAGAIERPQPTESQRLGTLLHCAVLEPERWEQRRIRPKMRKQGKRWEAEKEWRYGMELAHPEISVLESDDDTTVRAMLAALLAHDDVRAALEAPGVCEQSIRWVDEASGVRLKCRPDKLLHTGLVLDVKTTSDPSPQAFGWACERFGYWNQGDHYLRGLAATGVQAEWTWVCVQNKPPFEVGFYSATGWEAQQRLMEANQQNAVALAEMAECQRSGIWKSRYGERMQEVSVARRTGAMADWS